MKDLFQPNATRPIYEDKDFDWSSPIGVLAREAGVTWDPETESYSRPASGISQYKTPKNIVPGAGDPGALLVAKLKASQRSPWMIQASIGQDTGAKKYGGVVVCGTCGQEHTKFTSDSWANAHCLLCHEVRKASR